MAHVIGVLGHPEAVIHTKLINAFSEHLFYLSNRAEQARLLMNKKGAIAYTQKEDLWHPWGLTPGSSGHHQGPGVQAAGWNSCLGRQGGNWQQLPGVPPSSLWAKMREQWWMGAPFPPIPFKGSGAGYIHWSLHSTSSQIS